jgi:hypothetical protein
VIKGGGSLFSTLYSFLEIAAKKATNATQNLNPKTI